MKNLKPSQFKALSEFCNTIAAAWFSAGVISPFFIKSENLLSAIILGLAAILISVLFLGLSLYLVRRVKT